MGDKILESLEYTTRPSSGSNGAYVTVYAPDGSFISRHTSIEEASESAVTHAVQNAPEGESTYRLVPPEKHLSIRLRAPAGGNGTGGEADITPPDPPSGAYLSNLTSNSVRINWTNAGQNDIATTRIYKSTTSSTTFFTYVGQVTYPTTQYTDTINPTQQTWYRLTHVDNVGNESAFSSTFTDTTAPSAPSAPTASFVSSSSITLSLSGLSSAVDHYAYNIQKSTDGSTWSTVASNITATSWQDTGLSASTTYYYRLIDVDASGNASAAGATLTQATSAATAGTNAARINEILAGRSPHFSYSTYIPADPVTTRQETVTTAAGFNAAAAINGTRIIVNSSFSGNVQIIGDDIDVVMSNSATITGNLDLGTGSVYRCSRVRWTGGNINGSLTGRQFEDVLFDDVYFNSGTSANNITANSNRFDRIAFLNCTLQNSPPSSSGSSWVLFNMERPEPNHTGFMFLNSKAISTALHAFRLMSITGILVVDSVFNPTGTAGSGFRTHIRCVDVWVRDSWIRGRWHANEVYATDPAQVTNLLADNVDVYVPIGPYEFGYILDSPVPTPNTGLVQNGTLYSQWGAGSGSFSLFQMTYGTGNSRVAWDGSTVPDHSMVGAVR